MPKRSIFDHHASTDPTSVRVRNPIPTLIAPSARASKPVSIASATSYGSTMPFHATIFPQRLVRVRDQLPCPRNRAYSLKKEGLTSLPSSAPAHPPPVFMPLCSKSEASMPITTCDPVQFGRAVSRKNFPHRDESHPDRLSMPHRFPQLREPFAQSLNHSLPIRL